MSDERKEKKKTVSLPANTIPPIGPSFAVDAERHADVQARKDSFLAYYAEMGVLGEACDLAGVSRSDVISWTELDDAFKARREAIKEAKVDRVEEVLVKIATNDEEKAKDRITAAAKYLEANRAESYGRAGESGSHAAPQIHFHFEEKPGESPKVIDVKAQNAAKEDR